MSGLLGGLLSGAVQVRGAMLRGQAEGEELAAQRARAERVQRAQELAAVVHQQQADAKLAQDRDRDARVAARERARDELETHVKVGQLATQGVFAGALPTDAKRPDRYRDLGNGTYYDTDFSRPHQTELAGAARLAATIARRNAARNHIAGPSGHFKGSGSTRRMSPAVAEQARTKFADRALEAGGGDPRAAMGVLEGSDGMQARAAALAMTWPDYLAAAERHRTAPASRPSAKDAGDEQLRGYLRAKAQLRAQGKSAAEIRATLGAAPM